MTAIYIVLLTILTCPYAIAQPDATFFSLEEALKQPEEVYRLDLSYQELTAFPMEILQLKNLKRLNISNNEIQHIPKEIAELADLRRFIANDNQISCLPPEFFTLIKLKKLYLNDNKLKSVPASILQLALLKRIKLEGNNISQLPKELGQLDQLVYFTSDKHLLQSLPPFLDSLWTENPFPNWYVFDATPDSIEGRPLSYYLKCKDIDAYSKKIIQGAEILYRNEVEALGFLDSILTTNRLTQPYYFYMYERLNRDFGFYDNPHYQMLEEILKQRVRTSFLEQPCKIAEAFLEEEQHTPEATFARSLVGIDSLEVSRIMSGIKKDCSEYLTDEYTFYENFMNRFLPYDQQYGNITVALEGEKSLQYDKFELITIDPEGDLVSSYSAFTKRSYFSSMKPGNYTFYLYPSDLYQREEKQFKLDQIEKDLFSLFEYRPPRYSKVWLLDTTLTSLRNSVQITIPLDAIQDTSLLTDANNMFHLDMLDMSTSYPDYPNLFGFDNSSDSCEFFDLNPSGNIYETFMEEVYNTAAAQPNVSSENMKMLNDIKLYLSPTSIKIPDRITSEYDPLYPMFRNGFKSGGLYVSIFQEARWWNNFTYGNWEEQIKLDQKEFYESFVLNDFYVFYCNEAEASKHKVTKYDDFEDACSIRDAFPLFETDTSDKRIPAFASRHNLELEYDDFKEVNDLLFLKHKCEDYGGYCDVGESDKAFARMKGIPNLFFTSTTIESVEDSWWSDYYPARGLYMRTKDGRLIPLWHYYLEHVECSCI